MVLASAGSRASGWADSEIVIEPRVAAVAARRERRHEHGENRQRRGYV